jgi:hypothetical protein
MRNYMYDMIKFHTYSDFISETISNSITKEELKDYKDYQSYTAYPENEGFKLHRQSTRGCVGLKLSIIFTKLHINFLF